MQSAQGIILKREDFRERDERVVLYTKEFGKIAIVAKGTKRIEAKLRGNLDIFNFVDIIFVEGAGFSILTGVDLKERFLGIGNNFYIYKSAHCIADLADKVIGENMRDKELFDSIMLVFNQLNEYSKMVGRNIGAERDLYTWLFWKKFQLALLENQGYSTKDTPKLGCKAESLLDMLSGRKRNEIRLAKKDIEEVEIFFIKRFANLFNVILDPWVPALRRS